MNVAIKVSIRISLEVSIVKITLLTEPHIYFCLVAECSRDFLSVALYSISQIVRFINSRGIKPGVSSERISCKVQILFI